MQTQILGNIVSITIEIEKEFRFEAAHFLPKVDSSHKCHAVHGHSYNVILRACGPIDDKYGWVLDLSELSDKFSPLLSVLDHALLNNINGLENPTSENLAIWIFRKIGREFKYLSSVTVEATARVAVTVHRQEALFTV